jgi:hypothetical protein
MTTQKYLEAVLGAQTLEEEGAELKALRQHRSDVETLLRKHFKDCSPTIRYGGSYAKGTLIKEDYDLDVICYFPHDNTSAGHTLEDIYFNTREVLSGAYHVIEKPSALRLSSREGARTRVDFHIDVVPGRYTDETRGYTFLYQNDPTGERERLRTNLDIHLSHIKNSGVVPAVRLIKLWRVRNKVPVKTFAIELLTIELLQDKKKYSLEKQLTHIWTELMDNVTKVVITDTANPTGNDLSDLLNDPIRSALSAAASATLAKIEQEGWEKVFGAVEYSTLNAGNTQNSIGGAFMSKEEQSPPPPKPERPEKPEKPPKPPHPPGPDKPPKPPRPREVGSC